MKRARLLALCTAGVVAIGAGGFVLGRQVKSPADAAAQAAAPTASRLAVPVERRVIAATLITRGDVRFGDPKPVVLPASALKANLGNLVTLAATKGQEIEAGKRVLEVAGRPVLALVGSTPVYRDLRPGDQGDDVRQLEDGLSKLGFDPGPVDGRYDDATENGVDAWYRNVGYEPFGPTETQRTQLQTLRDGTTRAADGLRNAQRAYDSAARPARSRVLQADESVRSAKEKAATAPSDADDSARKADGLVAARQAALDQALATRVQAAAGVRRAERERDDSGAVREADLAVEDAKAAVIDADAAITQAERGVVEAQRSVDDARANVVDAQKSLDTAKENERRRPAKFRTTRRRRKRPGARRVACDRRTRRLNPPWPRWRAARTPSSRPAGPGTAPFGPLRGRRQVGPRPSTPRRIAPRRSSKQMRSSPRPRAPSRKPNVISTTPVAESTRPDVRVRPAPGRPRPPSKARSPAGRNCRVRPSSPRSAPPSTRLSTPSAEPTPTSPTSNRKWASASRPTKSSSSPTSPVGSTR